MSGTLTAESQVKTYRGATIEELLPQIRAELGAEAVIVRRREGLVGGVGGFFQKRCVEVDARAGTGRIDVYDEGDGVPLEEAAPIVEPAAPADTRRDPVFATVEPHPVRNDAATREGLATPGVARLIGEARPFADLLDRAVTTPTGPEIASEPEVAGGSEVEAESTPVTTPRRIAKLRQAMVANGLGADLAAAVVDSTVANLAPFATPGRLRTVVREELARRIPVAPAAAPGRRTVAVVGPAGSGKTAALARIAAAHAGAGQSVACLAVDAHDGGAALRALLGEPGATVESIAAAELAAAVAREAADLVLVDTPPASPGTPVAVTAIAAALAQDRPDEVHLALRAGTAAGAGAALLAGLGELAPNRILVTAAAETGHVGGVLDVAIRAGLPLSYVAADAGEILPADPQALARTVMT